MKKIKRKHIANRHHKKPQKTIFISRNISIVFGITLLIISITLVKATNRTHVLGIETGPMPAQPVAVSRQNDLDNLGKELDSTGNNLDQLNTDNITSPQEVGQTTTNTTQVDCVGPDGKHFTTSFKDCSSINKGWNNGHFTFTPLNPTIVPAAQGETGTTGGAFLLKGRLKTHNEQISTFDVNGEQVELVDTATQGALIKDRGTIANSNFPLSVDPQTHTLTVTTPSGVKQVAILPGQAIENLLQNKIFTSTESEGSTTSAEPATVSQTTTLTELNNDPVFQVNGIDNKKLLGFIPIGFSKTAFVSATSGQIVLVSESPFNKFLELLSF